MEIALFHHKPKIQQQTVKAPTNAISIVEPTPFLSEEKRPQLLQSMRALSSIETSQYDSLCTNLIEQLVNYCQKLPASTNTYYAQAGGLVDYALNRTEAALSLFKNIVAPGSETLSPQQTLWQYALFSAGLLQNIGTLFVDYKINAFDVEGEVKQWNPLELPLIHAGCQYDYELLKEPDVGFRHRLNLLLAKTLMPASGFSWIASNPQVLMVWLALLNEDYQGAGTLGLLLIRADAIALQRYFNDFLVNVKVQQNPHGSVNTFIDSPVPSVLEKEQIVGLEFLQWLSQALETGKIILNKGPLIMVPGGLLMTQELFQMYLDESSLKSQEKVQKGFLSLGLYVLGADGRAILRFDQGPNKGMVNGIVFAKYSMVLPNATKINSKESLSPIEVTNKVLHSSQYTQKPVIAVAPPIRTLASSGQWQVVEKSNLSQAFSPGARKGG
ncbi:MAG: TraI domain-containing protein [Legionella sp.]|nr:TraI domain-containing protein [Legionella sp.]